MEIISFEKRTFEEIAAKLDCFVQRVESLCREHGGKEICEWMDNHDVCRRLRISPRTLQTLRITERWPLQKSETGLITVLTM